MQKSYLDLRVRIPMNESNEYPLDVKMNILISDMSQHLGQYNGTIEDHSILTKEIVYTTSRGEDFTEEEVLSPIISWMSITEPFSLFTGQLYELAQVELYSVVISNLGGIHPDQKLKQFGLDEIKMVIDRMNIRINHSCVCQRLVSSFN
ncbi:hypothetical protein [Paenibacillus terrae]|uniref:Uncharacterized protein n=1 Tax=Paenibacillus terrae TaxID=159743 RepID=A0A0D7WUD6_9BACL|nr:hypothetical protein [Paenibacillus terrae]KJD42629.1 hypothetical protein QD47_27140 [Paenibacillus terrae]